MVTVFDRYLAFLAQNSDRTRTVQEQRITVVFRLYAMHVCARAIYIYIVYTVHVLVMHQFFVSSVIFSRYDTCMTVKFCANVTFATRPLNVTSRKIRNLYSNRINLFIFNLIKTTTKS